MQCIRAATCSARNRCKRVPIGQGRLVNPELGNAGCRAPGRDPSSGERDGTTLYVNSNFTTHFEGWTAKESKPPPDFLYQHAARPEFQTRFTWGEGSIAFWDNRATWHYALNDYQGERRLHDAVDGSSTGARAPRKWVLLRPPQFGGAKHADDHDNWSRYREVGLSGSRR